jgi:glycosyltransferase involved in cell wall biosynthesis
VPGGVLFLDLQAPKAYDSVALEERALGGTEATCVRVAEGLAARRPVTVAQAARSASSSGVGGARWLPVVEARREAEVHPPGAVVLIRRYDMAGRVADWFPRSRRLFWAHDLRRSRRVRQHRRAFARGRYTILSVSDFLTERTRRQCLGNPFERALDLLLRPPALDLRTLHNPIDDALVPDGTPVDPTRLLFLSAPAKGLAETLDRFAEVRRAMPDLVLEVAHPGYISIEGYRDFDTSLLRRPGVEVLGALPHAKILEHVRRAFCVFYPQTTKAETFGLVYAEANAVGTPVLAHDFGAAAEVLSDPDQLLDARRPGAVVERLRRWREEGRPRVHLKPHFRLSHVLAQWEEILDEPAG